MEIDNMNKSNIFTKILINFSVSVLVILLTGLLCGEEAQSISSMFELGGKGISYDTLLQFLFSSICIAVIQTIFHNEKLFRNISFLVRTILMMICITILMIIFIFYFKWFPAYAWEGWIGFILSFGACFGVATLLMILKTKSQNKIFMKRFEEYKENQKNQT